MSLQNDDKKSNSSDVAAAVAKETPELAEERPKTEKRSSEDDELTLLFSSQVAEDFRSRWDTLQIGFVDEPRHAVEQADELVTQVMKSLAKTFSDERGRLENQWRRGAQVSTEDLRLVLRRYRSFFQRLLSI